MNRLSAARVHRFAGAMFVACLVAACLKAAPSAIASPPLSADDVTWLFPPPAGAADLANLISIDDVTMPDPANPSARVSVWSDAAFKDFLAVADGSGAAVNGTSDRISLPPEARSRANWFIAGIRIDPGAPGLKDEVTKVFGRRPQIRIILQPVKRLGGQVDDFAAHLIFDFVEPTTQAEFTACPLHATPDDMAFQSVVNDVGSLRDKLANGELGAAKVVTAGQPLDIQPGLANPATRANLTAQMKDFLQRQLPHAQLNAMALMGLPSGSPSPWIFVSLQRGKTGFGAVLSPTLSGNNQFAMELTGVPQRVMPSPHTNNEAAVTCMSAVFGPQASPVALRKGVATADLIEGRQQDAATRTATVDRIADTSQSNFFNTDCISCHTVTEVGHVPVQGISPAVLQSGIYDVHNFGWSIDGSLKGSISRRTAAETADVVAWLNTNMPPK